MQGLADAFILMRYPFESPEAQLLNKQIFETIYYGALEASCQLAKEHGPYDTYEGSPVSKGVSGPSYRNGSQSKCHVGKPMRSGLSRKHWKMFAAATCRFSRLYALECQATQPGRAA